MYNLLCLFSKQRVHKNIAILNIETDAALHDNYANTYSW